MPPRGTSATGSPAPPQGYAPGNEREHLWDELRRIDQLVRAQTERWRQTIAPTKEPEQWGMILVSEKEVQAYLDAPYLPPGRPPAGVPATLRPYYVQAASQAKAIARRLGRTPAEVKAGLPLLRLCELYGLSELERDIVLVCLLCEIDERYRRLFGFLQDDASRARPSVELALQIVAGERAGEVAGRATFAEERPLLAQHLLSYGSDYQSALPLASRPLQLDPRVAAFLLGDDALDPRLATVAALTPRTATGWDGLVAPAELIARLRRLAEPWRGGAGRPRPEGLALLFHGPYGCGRRTAALAFCSDAGAALIAVDVGAALLAAEGWPLIVDLAYREARLRGAAIYWAGCEALLDHERAPEGAGHEQRPLRWEHLMRAAEQHPGLSFFASEVGWDPAGRFQDPKRPFVRVDFPVPDFELRRKIWERQLADLGAAVDPARDVASLARLLANTFQLTAGQIRDALSAARNLALLRGGAAAELTLDDLYEGCRRQSGRRLIGMAQLVAPRPAPDGGEAEGRAERYRRRRAALILPETSHRQLDDLQDRIHFRSKVYSDLGFERRLRLGKGLIGLFTGSSGTGKTMAAELLAGEERMDLYKIDLSAVVSKYVGETEKNLSRVFAEAADANAILFFDEADALFGKRGEVKEARDRWANMETNYLLQRIEEYAGVVILASNLRQNIDEAFLRRFHVIVEFPFPEAELRYQIWRGLLPDEATIRRPPDEQVRALAGQYRLSGGSIKNVVIDAAFRAMAAHDPARAALPEITVRQLVAGVARELQKLGEAVTPGKIGAEYYGWVKEDIFCIEPEQQALPAPPPMTLAEWKPQPSTPPAVAPVAAGLSLGDWQPLGGAAGPV